VPATEEGWNQSGERDQIETLARVCRLVIASLAGGIALGGFVLIFIGFARGVNPWALTGGSTVPGALLGVALGELRRLTKSSRKLTRKEGETSPPPNLEASAREDPDLEAKDPGGLQPGEAA
jgi:hypothetical protein